MPRCAWGFTNEFHVHPACAAPSHSCSAPFLGVMGVAPPPDMLLETGQPKGVVSTGPPNINGGNMDNRHLCVGSTVFFPVAVPGALFSCGDGHAAQGDGEVAGSAIETGMHVSGEHFNCALLST